MTKTLARGYTVRCTTLAAGERPAVSPLLLLGEGGESKYPTNVNYLLEEYPRKHATWLRKGRVLYLCSRAGGWGDYLRTIPHAFVLSVLLDLAFVLECDHAITSDEAQDTEVVWPKLLPRYFVGPHIAAMARNVR